MTDQQITGIAREYAEMAVPRFDMSEKQHAEAILRYTIEVRHFLRLLFDRYCLVEKSKLESTYNRIWNEWNFSLDAENKANSKFILSALESLFPEIAKEVEG